LVDISMMMERNEFLGEVDLDFEGILGWGWLGEG
jgi:hypothetical protein